MLRVSRCCLNPLSIYWCYIIINLRTLFDNIHFCRHQCDLSDKFDNDTDGGSVAKQWTEDEAARWLMTDVAGEMLDFPRRIAASLVAIAGEVSRVADIASGPGTFLKIFLDRFPNSTGVWQDASETMESAAKEVLAAYAPRITWLQGDMYHIASMGLPSELDVVLCSRATHHLTPDELNTFYAEVAQSVRPGGWIINLDHAYLGGPWDEMFRKARKSLLTSAIKDGENSGHRHERPAPSISDHIAALSRIGIEEVQTAWQAYYTFLIMARKPAV
ncbi:MAG: class I SAM-dependent methyltransferase [Actinomycetota bacterium]|nr:MAG: class I SAM-dependent methyltransferase [Actinomycetota bacterium]